MKCEICGNNSLSTIEDELICEGCGAAYGLELLGYYEEGSNDRIECGPEFDKWKREYESESKRDVN